MEEITTFLSYGLIGIREGCIYALVALGFTIIYNSTDIINFAQGEFVMLGAIGMIICSMLGINLIVGFVISVTFVVIVGFLFETLAIDYPLRKAKASGTSLIIITIGVSMLIKGIVMNTPIGTTSYSLEPFTDLPPLKVFNITIDYQYFWILGVTVVVVFGLSIFFNKTVIGKAMLACSMNKKAAKLMGINVNKIVLLSFLLSAAIGAIAGIIVAPILFTNYETGSMFGLKGFAAAILGGLGNSVGAVIGGLLLGIIESVGGSYLVAFFQNQLNVPIPTHYREAVAFFILLMILFLRPRGLLGKKAIEKV